MSAFPHHEPKYYFFGLRAGLTNFAVNGLRLGLKKTVGKVSQPINAASRFPEYDTFDKSIGAFLDSFKEGRRARILDVGSPKLFGLYLACTRPVDLSLTDISPINVDEYQMMWRGLQGRARGSATFSLEDARALRLPSGEFDVVYSMSVIEHVEGDAADSLAVQELLRVLKPGGLLVISVPFGGVFMAQQRVGFSGAARKTGDQEHYFFQRIYDPETFRRRLLDPAGNLASVSVTTVARKRQWLAQTFGKLGENVRGALGFMNPLLSLAMNSTKPGIDASFPTSYGTLHSASDVYGDIILAGIKR